MKCKARANFVVDEVPRKYVITKEHNHPKDLIEKRVLDFMKQLKLACQSGLNMTLIQTYENIARMWEKKIGNFYIFFLWFIDTLTKLDWSRLVL